MDDVKKKVLADLFLSPGTILPVVGGLSAFMLSWAIGGSSTALNLVGLAGVLGGAGMFATRLIFGLEKMTKEADELLKSRQEQQQLAALDELEKNLRRDRDRRTQKCLRELRHMYFSFRRDVHSGKIRGGAASDVLSTVEQLFDACVDQLGKSYTLYKTASKLTGNPKQELLNERDQIVREVLETLDHLAKTIRQFHQFSRKNRETDLTSLRAELDETMRVAQRTEERLANIGQPSFDATEFEEADETQDREGVDQADGYNAVRFDALRAENRPKSE